MLFVRIFVFVSYLLLINSVVLFNDNCYDFFYGKFLLRIVMLFFYYGYMLRRKFVMMKFVNI